MTPRWFGDIHVSVKLDACMIKWCGVQSGKNVIYGNENIKLVLTEGRYNAAKNQIIEKCLRMEKETNKELKEDRSTTFWIRGSRVKSLKTEDIDFRRVLFLRFCMALGRVEDIPFLIKFIDEQLCNYFNVSPYARGYTDELKLFWKGPRHIPGSKAWLFERRWEYWTEGKHF